MLFRIGLENGIEGRSLAWALDFPGCFAYGADGPAAVVAMGRAIPAYIAWLERHGAALGFDPSEIDIRLVETWDVYSVNADLEPVPIGYEVNAWFRDDWRPFDPPEIERGALLLAYSREDLLRAVSGLSAEELDVKQPGERWSLRGILKHVANAERWYLECLEQPVRESAQLSGEAFERLAQVRADLLAALPGLAGSRQVLGKEGEFWSPRKLLRRAVWHELDHVEQLRKLAQIG